MTAPARGITVRVLSGQPDDAELTAVTVALLALCRTGDSGDRPPARPAYWEPAPGHQGPGSWAARRPF